MLENGSALLEVILKQRIKAWVLENQTGVRISFCCWPLVSKAAGTSLAWHLWVPSIKPKTQQVLTKYFTD